MVKVMPTQNSALNLQRPGPLLACLACAFVLFAAGTARAAAEEASSGDLFSTVFSTYGIAGISALLLIGLFVFRRVRTSKQTAAFARPERRARPRESYLTPPAPRTPNPALPEEVAATSQQLALRSEK